MLGCLRAELVIAPLGQARIFSRQRPPVPPPPLTASAAPRRRRSHQIGMHFLRKQYLWWRSGRSPGLLPCFLSGRLGMVAAVPLETKAIIQRRSYPFDMNPNYQNIKFEA